jgi:ABC-2 type transport system ATP-binding protein
VQVTAHDAAEVETLLAACAPPACGGRLEIGRADLEDVFLEIMAKEPVA